MGVLLAVNLAEIAAAEPTAERVLIATALGMAATISLLIGALLGLFTRPAPRLVAAILAFGSGALIHSLVVELAAENLHGLIREHGFEALVGWSWIALGFVAGGATYNLANHAVAARGGAFRKRSTAQAFVLRHKRAHAAGLLDRLSRVELLRSLSPEDIHHVLPHVRRMRVRAGEVIYGRDEPPDAVYLVDEGRIVLIAESPPPAIPAPAPASGAAPAHRGRHHVDRDWLAAQRALAIVGPGETFGEIDLLSDQPRLSYAIARDDGHVLRIGRAELLYLIHHSAGFRRQLEESDLRHTLGIMRSASEADAARWTERALAGIQSVNLAEHQAVAEEIGRAGEKKDGGLPLAIFLGALLDGIPESVVIGASFVTLAAFNPGFLIAVFLSNLPEAMSSAVAMRRGGFSTRRIITLWLSLVIASGVAAGLGNLVVSSASPLVPALVQAFAGGGILAMLASTMMPEAFEEGGPEVGLATIAGFASAFLFTALNV